MQETPEDSVEVPEREARTSPIDAHVGSRIRLRRTMLGMSQEKLGEALGLTFQQVQKYERGTNRVGASRLFDLSRILEVPVAYFFDNIPERISTSLVGYQPRPTGLQEEREKLRDTGELRTEIAEVTEIFGKISDPVVRRRVRDLLKALADVNV